MQVNLQVTERNFILFIIDTNRVMAKSIDKCADNLLLHFNRQTGSQTGQCNTVYDARGERNFWDHWIDTLIRHKAHVRPSWMTDKKPMQSNKMQCFWSALWQIEWICANNILHWTSTHQRPIWLNTSFPHSAHNLGKRYHEYGPCWQDLWPPNESGHHLHFFICLLLFIIIICYYSYGYIIIILVIVLIYI